jgi:hypothetical protein
MNNITSGVHIVGTGSGAPEVPEPPSARGYSRATRPQGGHKFWGLVLQVEGWAQG